MRFNGIKWEQEGAVTRKYDAAREKGGDNFKKSDFSWFATDWVAWNCVRVWTIQAADRLQCEAIRDPAHGSV